MKIDSVCVCCVRHIETRIVVVVCTRPEEETIPSGSYTGNTAFVCVGRWGGVDICRVQGRVWLYHRAEYFCMGSRK